MYFAQGHQVFVFTSEDVSELFLTLHQTNDNPVSLETQAKVMADWMNEQFSQSRETFYSEVRKQ